MSFSVKLLKISEVLLFENIKISLFWFFIKVLRRGDCKNNIKFIML